VSEETVDVLEAPDDEIEAAPVPVRRDWSCIVGLGVVPAVIAIAVGAAGYLKWSIGEMDSAETARIEAVRAATDGTIAMLSYQPQTVEEALHSARDRMSGPFRDAYSELVDRTVIPGAREKKVSAVVDIPAAATISATAGEAEVLVFVNQTTTIGDGAPTSTASSVKVTLVRTDSEWLISDFTPV
jgi:Mce-associated membrane protein